ncbi:MAG: DNA polymerase I, partial [Planctomycetota bacterium]
PEKRPPAREPPPPARRPSPTPVPEGSAAAGECIYLIDGHATIYRAYFAIKTKLSAPGTGKATHAAFGFTRIVRALLAESSPEYLAVAMDSPGPTFRHEIYPKYKSTRPAMPDDLQPQIGMVERVCEAYGIPVHKKPGFEADDVIGTLARQAAERGLDVVIVSGDKDLLQLVSDADSGRGSVSALDPQKGKKFTPAKVPKTATQLVQKYGSLEAAIDAARDGKEKGKRRERLIEFEEQAKLSRVLATIRTDAPVALDLDAARVGQADEKKLIEVFRELGFREFLKSIAPSGAREALRYRTVDTPEALAKLAEELGRLKSFAFDTETDSTRPRRADLVGMSFSWKPKEAAYVVVRAPEGERALGRSGVLDALRSVLEDESIGKIAQNAKYDMLVLRRAGVEVKGLDFDTMVGSYLLDPGSRSHGIDALAMQHLGFRKIATAEVIGKGKSQVKMDEVPVLSVAPYACEDADIAWRLYGVIERRVRDGGFEKLYRDLELPLVDVLAEIEWNGIAVDEGALSGLAAGMADMLEIDEKTIYEAAGHEFKINSTKELARVLYEELGLPVVKKTPKGAPSTDSDVLGRLSQKHDLPKALLRYRQLSKLKSTYADALPGYVNRETGRIHASFHQTVTATGRLSSSDPNLQNIPVRSELGRGIRQCFVAEEGRKLLSADYSQIELRLLAHLSKDARLVDAFNAGQDIHSAVAAELAGCPIEDVTKDMRRRAKTVNFGLMYGQGAQHLARSTGMTFQEADAFISDYFHRFEGVGEFRSTALDGARDKGRLETMLGRI